MINTSKLREVEGMAPNKTAPRQAQGILTHLAAKVAAAENGYSAGNVALLSFGANKVSSLRADASKCRGTANPGAAIKQLTSEARKRRATCALTSCVLALDALEKA